MPKESRKENSEESSKENDLEGAQDQGGKHGGQAGMPKPPPRPATTQRDEDTPKASSAKRWMAILRYLGLRSIGSADPAGPTARAAWAPRPFDPRRPKAAG